MKTIKLIDLLNKIANEEEVPKKIAIQNDVLIYNEAHHLYLQDYYYMNDEENATWKIWCYKLNDEVEILDKNFKLEETPKISKLYINKVLQYKLEEKKIPKIIPEALFEEYTKGAKIYQLYKTVSEIIDYLQYLKSKEKENKYEFNEL